MDRTLVNAWHYHPKSHHRSTACSELTKLGIKSIETVKWTLVVSLE
ncbi:hypothetical protein HanPSC8_Chr16g0701381 [Helianthus annuus]|nr:hypothetical protein HanPSC8_Chr16g0701381 [Helianthus annuus]